MQEEVTMARVSERFMDFSVCWPFTLQSVRHADDETTIQFDGVPSVFPVLSKGEVTTVAHALE